jgi:hypothetical protein
MLFATLAKTHTKNPITLAATYSIPPKIMPFKGSASSLFSGHHEAVIGHQTETTPDPRIAISVPMVVSPCDIIMGLPSPFSRRDSPDPRLTLK